MSNSNDKLMERVRNLLTQAEHPNTSQAESEAFTAKAAALMAKYGIDQALVAERGEVRETVARVRIAVDAPYAREKAMLLGQVARSTRCRPIQHAKGRTVAGLTLFGFPSDLERAQVLYTSLLLQATRDVMRAQVPYSEQAAVYRRTWLVGFASAVGKRLQSAEDHAQRDAEAQQSASSRSVALVLADRSSIVDAAVATAFPALTKGRKRQLTGSGLRAGYAAGQRADIGSTRVSSASRRGIGGVR